MELVVELSVSDETCSVALILLLCDERNWVLNSHSIHVSCSVTVNEVTCDTVCRVIEYRVSRVHADSLSDSALVSEVVLSEHTLTIELTVR